MYICIITNNIKDYSLGYSFNWTINKIVYIPRLLSVSPMFQAVLSMCLSFPHLRHPAFSLHQLLIQLRLPLSRN